MQHASGVRNEEPKHALRGVSEEPAMLQTILWMGAQLADLHPIEHRPTISHLREHRPTNGHLARRHQYSKSHAPLWQMSNNEKRKRQNVLFC